MLLQRLTCVSILFVQSKERKFNLFKSILRKTSIEDIFIDVDVMQRLNFFWFVDDWIA